MRAVPTADLGGVACAIGDDHRLAALSGVEPIVSACDRRASERDRTQDQRAGVAERQLDLLHAARPGATVDNGAPRGLGLTSGRGAEAGVLLLRAHGRHT